MNARQKAKKYKKIAERYKEKAEAWDKYARLEELKYVVRKYGTIETLKVAKYWDDRIPEEFIKREISQDFAECLLRDGYIEFEVNNNYNEYNMMRRVIATLKVSKGVTL
ncbi:MAG: hypothetical protein IKU41_03040 [Clostridia bacterium]|nr:hypothetical protein [Clostridia bacterium]